MKKIFTVLALAVCSCLLYVPLNGQEAYMGVHYNQLHKKKASTLKFEKPNGAYLTSVVAGSPAQQIGMEPFDYLYKIGDYEFTEEQDFGDIMDKFKVGQSTPVYFVRAGQKMSKTITFGDESDNSRTHRSAAQDPFLGIERNHDDVPKLIVGVPVNITKQSTADKMGLENGDIITNINDYPIYDMHDAGAAIDMLEIGETISVNFLRDSKKMEAAEPIQSLATTRTKRHEARTAVPEEDLLGQIEEVDISLLEVPVEEVEEMKEERGVDMPIIQNLAIEQLKIFPNPNQGLFNLQFTLLKKAPTSVRIFDATGQLVFANDYDKSKVDFNEQIDLSNYAAGAYYLMIQQRKNSVTKKVVIVRD